jgi:hypothetical protein
VFVEFDETALRDIFNVKRLVLCASLPAAVPRVMNDAHEPSEHAADAGSADLLSRYLRSCCASMIRSTYRELLSSTMDSYLTQVSNRLATSTKGLSLVATMSLPFVVVSGMWGMNHAHSPVLVEVWLLAAAGHSAGSGRRPAILPASPASFLGRRPPDSPRTSRRCSVRNAGPGIAPPPRAARAATQRCPKSARRPSISPTMSCGSCVRPRAIATRS